MRFGLLPLAMLLLVQFVIACSFVSAVACARGWRAIKYCGGLMHRAASPQKFTHGAKIMTVKIGGKAPEFSLSCDDGSVVQLSSFRGRQVILYFYPKDDTPGCTTQACGFRDNQPQLAAANAVVLGISPDGLASHAKFKLEQKLNFSLLSDPDHAVAELYGVWGEKSMYGKKYMGIVRSHFVIDAAGNIADVQVGVKPEASVELAIASVSG